MKLMSKKCVLIKSSLMKVITASSNTRLMVSPAKWVYAQKSIAFVEFEKYCPRHKGIYLLSFECNESDRK